MEKGNKAFKVLFTPRKELLDSVNFDTHTIICFAESRSQAEDWCKQHDYVGVVSEANEEDLRAVKEGRMPSVTL